MCDDIFDPILTIFSVEDDEKEVLTLSNDRVLNFFTGKGLLKNKAVLTNRRLYINEHKGIISYAYSRDVVELDEVTGTSIVKRNPIWSLVMAGGLACCRYYFNVDYRCCCYIFAIPCADTYTGVYILKTVGKLVCCSFPRRKIYILN